MTLCRRRRKKKKKDRKLWVEKRGKKKMKNFDQNDNKKEQI